MSKKPANRNEQPGAAKGVSAKRSARLSQSDVPAYSLEDALRVASAIADHYAKKPTAPVDVAIAMDMSPTSGPFRSITGACAAYGVTEGAAQADLIELTPLGLRIVSPTVEGDDLAAKREAVMRPRVIREFLTKYDGSPLPKENIALNVLEQMGVPTEATQRAFDMIVSNATPLGLMKAHKGKTYVRLAPAAMEETPQAPPLAELEGHDSPVDTGPRDEPSDGIPDQPVVEPVDIKRNKRVFITHGKNRQIVEQLKELLTFGDMEPVVSVEKESVAKPVPDKVLGDMRSCAAAIVHVGSEMKLLDEEGNEHLMLNPNVLIEIGAAMALYERRFILLVEKGVTLPSNLQGLYEVRYEGQRLDYEATMKLLRAFNDFKASG